MRMTMLIKPFRPFTKAGSLIQEPGILRRAFALHFFLFMTCLLLSLQLRSQPHNQCGCVGAYFSDDSLSEDEAFEDDFFGDGKYGESTDDDNPCGSSENLFTFEEAGGSNEPTMIFTRFPLNFSNRLPTLMRLHLASMPKGQRKMLTNKRTKNRRLKNFVHPREGHKASGHFVALLKRPHTRQKH